MLDRVSFPEESVTSPPMKPKPVDMSNTHLSRILDARFYYDMMALLQKKRAGGFFDHVLTGETFSLWEAFTKAAEKDGAYYQFNNEADLIKDNPDWFKGAIGMKDGETSMVAELGTGSANSLRHKTIPFVEAVNASVYVGIDESFASAFGAVQGVRENNPDIAAFFRPNLDFNKDNLKIAFDDLKSEIRDGAMIEGKRIKGAKLPSKLPEHRVMAMFGGTLANAEGFSHDPLPKDYVVGGLRNYRRHLDVGDTLFLGLDQNQKKNALYAGYSDDHIAQFSMGLLWRIKKELPVSKEFNPNDFEYKNQWFPKSNLFAHGFTAKKDGQFTIQDLETGRNIPISFKQGEFFAVYCNSYKFPQKFVDEVIAESGFRLKDSIADNRQWVHIHALQAV